MGNKPRWETKYEKFLSEEPITEKIESMKVKIEYLKSGKVTGNFKTKEEYEKAVSTKEKEISVLETKLTEYERFMKNKDKIANVLEYRKSLETKLDKLPKDTSGQLLNKKQEIDAIGKRIDHYLMRIEETKEDLKNVKRSKNSDQESDKAISISLLNNTLLTYNDVLSKLQDKQYNLYKEIRELEEGGKNLNQDSINERILLERRIAKCNLLAANLLKGKNIEDIQLKKVEGKFTSKEENLKKQIQVKEEEQDAGKNNINIKQNLPSNVTKIEEKHSIISRIKNNIKKFFENIKNKLEKSVVKDEPEQKNSIEQEISNNVEQMLEEEKTSALLNEREDELLKAIAEKGAHAVFTEKLLVNKKIAIDREAKKYGGTYDKQNTSKSNKKITQGQVSHEPEGK